MKNKVIIIVLLGLLVSNFIIAQEQSKVIVSTTESSEIWVKWYSEYVYFDYPVFLFRQQRGSNEWKYIDRFERGAGLSNETLQKDKVLEVIQNSVMGSRAKDLDGITLLILMLKSVEHPELSDFLGIQYIDKTASQGMEYRYQICKSNNPSQNPLGISEYITAAKFVENLPPAEIKAWQDEYKVNFVWQADEDKFMGVNVYRKIDEGNLTRITPVPVIYSVDEKGNYPDVFYTDDSVEIDREYMYILKGIDYFGRESKASKELVVKIKDVSAPPAPSKLVVDVTGTQVQLFWENENVPDLEGYRVYRLDPNNLEYLLLNNKLIPKNFQTFTDTVTQTGVYNYKVATVDVSGNESLSDSYIADVKDIFPPAIPQNLVAVSDTGIIRLTWDTCNDTDLMGYYIYRSVNNNPNAYMLLNADACTENIFTDKLPKQVRNNFAYKVVAVDSAYNKSGYSTPAYIGLPDVTAPDVPLIKTITRQNNTLIVEWYPVYDSDIAGYNIYRYVEPQSPENAEKINIDLISKLTVFTDRFANYNTTYKYYIVAVDTEGNFSAPSKVYTAPQLLPPPSNIEFERFDATFKQRKNQIQLTWKVNEPDEIKGFVVYCKTENQKHFTPLSGLIPESAYQEKLKSEKGTYQYRIGAIGNDGAMYYSEPKEIMIKNL
jgi:fibronectin type 3 domain-containing protein